MATRCNHCGNNGSGRISCHYCQPDTQRTKIDAQFNSLAVGAMRKSIGHSDPHHVKERTYPGLKEAIENALK